MFRLLVCQSTRLLEQLHGINNSRTRLILTALLVAAAYYFGALFSFALRVPSTRSSIIWAPNAVLLAALVVTPYRTWWIWLVAALPAHLLAQARDGASIVLLLCPFLANVAQAVLAAAGMRRFTDAPHRLESFRDMGIFILVAVLAVPAVVSFAAAWLFVAAGWENNYWLVAWARLLNNVLTGLAVAPLCLAIASGDLSKLRRLHVSHFIELAIILIGLAGILSAVSASQASEMVRFALRLYAPLPFLIWAAVRFGPAGLSITLLIVAYDAISDSIAGHGPFTTGSPVGNVLALEASLSALSLPMMLLAALMREGKRKEKALRESEARYRALVTASSEIVWLANADGEGFFVTPAWQELTGQSEEESRNSGWLNAVHPDDRQRCERLWNEAMAQRNVYEHELRVRGLDGSYRHFHVHAVPILSSQGSVHEWVGAVTDITDRKRSEHILRESEERFRNMAEYAPVMIWISASDGACTYVNKRWTDFTGTTGERAYGFHRLDGVHEKDRKITSEIITHANQRREGFRVEYHMRRYDGEYRWVIDSASPRFNEDGEFLGYIGSIIDITERKQAEEALRESEERFARTEKFSLVMVTHTDLEGRWLKIPPTLCQLLGYTEEELLGRNFAEVTHPDDASLNIRERTRLLAGEIKSFDLEKRYIRKDGGIVWVYINVSVVMNLSGRPVHCLSYIRDITKHKRAEQSLRESEERLQLALEGGGMGIWDWNKQTNELQWSGEHFTIMGLAPFSVKPTYRTWAERLHPDDLPVVAAEMKQAIAERRHYQSEYRIFLNDRSTRWVTSRGEPIYNRAGECVRVMGVVVDTTERKRAESRLNVQYNVTRALSASASLADGAPALIETICECFDWHYGEIWQVDPENNELRYLEGCSPSGASTGFISDSRQFTFARGVGLPGRVWKSGRPEWMTNIAIEPGFRRAALAEKAGLKCAFAFPVNRGERTLAVMAFFSREIRQPDQEMLHIMESIGSQIGQFAERKEAENALRASEERHRAILESSLDSIVTIDHRGTIIEFNPAAEETFGYKRQDAIGKQVGELLVPPALRGKHFRGLAHFLTKGEATILDKRVEMTAMRADGSEIPIELAVTRIRLDGPPMFTGYIRDISQRKRADEALRHALTEVQRLKEKVEADNVYLREELSETHRYGEIVGRSTAIEKVLRQVRQVAVTDMTALILGETGTGKELVARAIHESSARRQRPLVKVNCSALPAELMESELFGHERGAFTGALTKRVGRFEVADGGTIFLDEIGDLALSLQAKLLRVLQEGEFERLGSSKTIRVNVRVIAATNRDLSDAMRKEAFRSDLYYRLAVYPISIPPLRDRKEDIGQLAESFLYEASRRLGRSFEAIPRRVHEALLHYDWPGNVRELQNVIERAAVTSTGRFLQLPEEWHPEPEPNKAGAQLNGIDYPLGRTGSTLEDLERAHIIQVLNQTRWRIEGTKGAAMILGLHPSTLRSRMNKLGISRSESIEL